MLKFLFGGKKRKAKSVNDIRAGKPGRPSSNAEGNSPDLDARIKARKAKNMRMADVKAALASAGYIARPDISGAIQLAKGLSAELEKRADSGVRQSGEHKAAIDRALRLKGSARVIDEALTHPAWRYVAMAIIRGHLEERAADEISDADGPRKALKGQRNSP